MVVYSERTKPQSKAIICSPGVGITGSFWVVVLIQPCGSCGATGLSIAGRRTGEGGRMARVLCVCVCERDVWAEVRLDVYMFCSVGAQEDCNIHLGGVDLRCDLSHAGRRSVLTGRVVAPIADCKEVPGRLVRHSRSSSHGNH